jgi:hypothetical protein
MNVCLIVLSCLVLSDESNSKSREYKPCAIEISKIKEIQTSDNDLVYIKDFGLVKETVPEIAQKVNSCQKSK